jgi:uncharacterized protein
MNESKSTAAAAILGLLLAAGLAIAGFFVGNTLSRARSAERQVTVKGLSEREVPANLVLWPIVFNTTGNDLGAVQSEAENVALRIETFLKNQGFEQAEISRSAPRVTDYLAQGYNAEGRAPAERYMVEMTTLLRTSKVDTMQKAVPLTGELVRAGVTLVRSYEESTQYLFTDLEKIKPEMIAEATQDARRAAEQFAKDSGSQVGDIRSAQQGYFSVEDRDAFSPQWKKVRVVTSVEYFLR